MMKFDMTYQAAQLKADNLSKTYADIVLASLRGFRIPEPLPRADALSKIAKGNYLIAP